MTRRPPPSARTRRHRRRHAPAACCTQTPAERTCLAQTRAGLRIAAAAGAVYEAPPQTGSGLPGGSVTEI